MVDYVNRGSDPRLFGKVGAYLQTWLSFHAPGPPANRLFYIGQTELLVAWPPFVSLNVARPRGRFASFRAGWRYDKNWAPGGGYIADVIIKLRMTQRVHF